MKIYCKFLGRIFIVYWLYMNSFIVDWKTPVEYLHDNFFAYSELPSKHIGNF